MFGISNISKLFNSNILGAPETHLPTSTRKIMTPLHHATHFSSRNPFFIKQPIFHCSTHFSSRHPFFIAQPIFHHSMGIFFSTILDPFFITQPILHYATHFSSRIPFFIESLKNHYMSDRISDRISEKSFCVG